MARLKGQSIEKGFKENQKGFKEKMTLVFCENTNFVPKINVFV